MRLSSTRRHRPLGLVWPLLSLLLASRSCESASFGGLKVQPTAFGIGRPNPTLLELRGGASATPTSSSSTTIKKKSNKAKTKKAAGSIKAKKKSKAKKPQGDGEDTGGNSKGAIKDAMEKDSAQALGDAIRSRADELRSHNPLLDRIDHSVYSVGLALGASDRPPIASLSIDEATTAEDDGGGVAGSPSSVLASYFLKSHGGAHALQCVCSVLASSAGFASLLLPANGAMQRVLMKRTLLFAMTKHIAGLLGAALVAGRAIPNVGLHRARVWMEQLASDPVSQYVFYAACVLLWLPSQPQTPLVVFGDKIGWVPLVLVLPILLREAVSTMLVISDVLVLWAASVKSSGEDDEPADDNGQEAIENLLQVTQKGINVVMSLLVTPETWKTADPAERQRILAKLTSQVSLALEVVVGLILTVDSLARMMQFVFGTAGSAKPALLSVMKRLLCARLYLQFLWSRKRKINKLAVNIRGGATQLPFYVLDVLLDPIAAMGLDNNQQQEKAKKHSAFLAAPTAQQQSARKASSKSKKKKKDPSREQQQKRVLGDLDWKDYVSLVLGLDED